MAGVALVVHFLATHKIPFMRISPASSHPQQGEAGHAAAKRTGHLSYCKRGFAARHVAPNSAQDGYCSVSELAALLQSRSVLEADSHDEVQYRKVFADKSLVCVCPPAFRNDLHMLENARSEIRSKFKVSWSAKLMRPARDSTDI